MDREKKPPENHDPVDKSMEESFPASDPPSFTPESHIGPPEHDEADQPGVEGEAQDADDKPPGSGKR